MIRAVYLTFEAAAHRVDILRQSGTWPGIVCRRDGTFALTFDPEDRSGQ